MARDFHEHLQADLLRTVKLHEMEGSTTAEWWTLYTNERDHGCIECADWIANIAASREHAERYDEHLKIPPTRFVVYWFATSDKWLAELRQHRELVHKGK